jgi:hypothetical protein
MSLKRNSLGKINSGDRMERIYGVKNLQFLGQSLKRIYALAENHNIEREWLKKYLIKLSLCVKQQKEKLNSGRSSMTQKLPSPKLCQNEEKLSNEKSVKDFEEFMKSSYMLKIN